MRGATLTPTATYKADRFLTMSEHDSTQTTDGHLPAVTPFPVEKVVAWTFAGVAAVLLLVATLTGISAARHTAREVQVGGRVVALTPRTVSVPRDADDPDRDRGRIDREFFYPVVEFALPDGTTKTVQTAEGSWPPAYEPGQAVAVRYDRDNPLDARIASPGGTVLRWTWTLITAPLGLVFAAVSGLIFWAFARKK